MNSVEKTGKTVKEATDLALSELNVKEDDAIIEVLDEGNKGIFGLFNTRMAKVKVTVKKRISHEGKEFLQALLKKMDLEAQVEVRENEDTIIYNIISKDGGVIIGRRGETLDAIQFLTGLVVNKNSEIYKKVIVDTENYREKRKQPLSNLANRLAKKVYRTGKSHTFEPMNPYERRIIHYSLQKNPYVETYSIGEEPNRRVVIKVKEH
ncbi:MAG: protein jag [Clostridiaceae bacterium]|nr:protein jag [Clostridiaceae bacterium]